MCTKEGWRGPGAQAVYENLLVEAQALLSAETDWLANLANAAALIYSTLPDLNWAGFYLTKRGELVLGPFQGKPACVRIPWGRGVCGTAAQRRATIVVPDVHQFPGHIACDPASRSEIVVPIIHGGNVWGVLDLDSPYEGRFSQLDQQYLEQLVELLNKHIDWQAACSSR
ncbi:MAG: GAF domain-containing protein [Firmicutes bacterium]|nr:GAF domain-containing protein [Bacillota bacterium]